MLLSLNRPARRGDLVKSQVWGTYDNLLDSRRHAQRHRTSRLWQTGEEVLTWQVSWSPLLLGHRPVCSATTMMPAAKRTCSCWESSQWRQSLLPTTWLLRSAASAASLRPVCKSRSHDDARVCPQGELPVWGGVSAGYIHRAAADRQAPDWNCQAGRRRRGLPRRYRQGKWPSALRARVSHLLSSLPAMQKPCQRSQSLVTAFEACLHCGCTKSAHASRNCTYPMIRTSRAPYTYHILCATLGLALVVASASLQSFSVQIISRALVMVGIRTLSYVRLGLMSNSCEVQISSRALVKWSSFKRCPGTTRSDELGANVVQVLRAQARHQSDFALEGMGSEQPLQADRICREQRHCCSWRQTRRSTLLHWCQPAAHLVRGVSLPHEREKMSRPAFLIWLHAFQTGHPTFRVLGFFRVSLGISV